MSITLATVGKKIVLALLTKKKTWKFITTAVGIAVTIALLPVIVLLAMGNSMGSIENESIDFSQYIQNLSPEQQTIFSQMKLDGQAIIDEMTKLNLQNEIVKAQIIYLTYFENVQKHQYFFTEYCSFFNQGVDDEELINLLNDRYDLEIDYEEFMRSYSVIRNVSIDSYLFVNLEIKNNIDLARWAENAYETQWGYVPHTVGDVLYSENYAALKDKYPDEITEECDQWVSRRTADNLGLLYSYLWYNAEERNILSDESQKTAQELFNSASAKGEIESIPDTIGLAVFDGENLGIYIGNNEIIYAKSIADGIVKENIADGNWFHWFEISGIAYGEEKSFSSNIDFSDCYDPSVKNNLDLVKWAENANEQGWGYVYGTYGNVLTESILQDRASVFGGQVTNYFGYIRQNWLGKRTADCMGLIKGYGWYDNESGEIIVGSNGMKDVTANGMYEVASVKGSIDSIPDVPGLAVWHKEHIGVYIGNGEVIEAMNTLKGVTKTKLSNRWTHWLQIPFIDYVEEELED